MFPRAKSLIIFLPALLILSSWLTPTAFATPMFQSSSYPATITGTSASGNEIITTEAGKVECAGHFEGTLSEESSSLMLHATYTSCKAFGFLSATLTTTGCHKHLHHTRKLADGSWLSHYDYVCTPSAPSPPSYKLAASTCEFEIKPQTGIESANFTNSGSSIVMLLNGSGIAYTVTKDGFGCPFSGTGNKTGATETMSAGVTLSSSGKTIQVVGE